MKQTPPPSPKRPRRDLLQHEHEDPNAAPPTKRETEPSQYHNTTSGFQHTHPLLPYYQQPSAPFYNSRSFSGLPADSYLRPVSLPQTHLPSPCANSIVPYPYGTPQPSFYSTPYLYQLGFGSPRFGRPEFIDHRHREDYEPQRSNFPVPRSSSTLSREAGVETSHYLDLSSAYPRSLRPPHGLQGTELEVTSPGRIAFTGTGKDSLEHCKSSADATSKQTVKAMETSGVATSSSKQTNPDEQKDMDLSSRGIRRKNSDKSNSSTRVRSAKVDDLIYIGRLEQDLDDPLNRVRIWKDLRGRKYYDCKCGRRKACHDLKRIKEHVLKHGSEPI